MKLIQLANSTAQSVLTNEPINLGVIDRRVECNCNVFDTTNTTITLNKSGFYLVSVDANVTASADGNVGIQLYDSMTPIATAVATNVATSGDIYNLSFSKIIRVLPNTCLVGTNAPKILSVYNTGITSTINTINISVIKVN